MTERGWMWKGWIRGGRVRLGTRVEERKKESSVLKCGHDGVETGSMLRLVLVGPMILNCEL